MANTVQPVPALIASLLQAATPNTLLTLLATAAAPQNAEPEDTVTIANDNPAGAPAAPVVEQAQVQLQEVALVINEPAVPLLNAGAANNAAPASTANAAADPAAANAGNNFPAPAADNGANAANNAAQTAQELELAQLDQVLEQLGIPPSSIPAVEQLAMLAYRFDPQALLQFVNSLGGLAQQATAQASVNNGNNAAALAPQDNAVANTPAVPNGGFAAQFQELQLAFTAVGVEPAGARALAAAAGAGAAGGGAPPGATLNVKA